MQTNAPTPPLPSLASFHSQLGWRGQIPHRALLWMQIFQHTNHPSTRMEKVCIQCFPTQGHAYLGPTDKIWADWWLSLSFVETFVFSI